MKNLNIGDTQIPLNAASKTFAILAKRGAGKSYTAAVMAEEFAECGIPFVVFDPIDVWWGLRLAANGKDKGLPVVVFGLEHADIRLERGMGKAIAQAVVAKNISCVISTFGLPKVAQREIIADFATELLNINNTPRHVFIEEAHEFVPQRVMGDMGKCFAAVESLVVMGRNRGIGVTLINQRAATINKDVLTQLDTLLAFRNVSPQDRKALKEWVEHHSAEGDFNKFMDSLPSLPTGEGWIWSPEFMNVFKRIKIRKRRTFHPDREKNDFKMPELSSLDIDGFISDFTQKMAKVREEPKGKKEKTKSVEIIHAAPIVNINEIKNQYESRLIEKDTIINALTRKISQISAIIGLNDVAVIDNAYSEGSETNAMLDKLGGMAKNVYTKLLQHPGGLTKRQIGLMCAYSINSGSLRNAFSKLNTMGLIRKEGDIFKALTR